MKSVPPNNRALDTEEVRLVSDLPVMHAKVRELYGCVESLRKHHAQRQVLKYADAEVLLSDIRRADEIYQFFVTLAEDIPAAD